MLEIWVEFWVQPAADGNISLSDLETVKVLGKGSGGVVQLVRHKWTNETYALKVKLYIISNTLNTYLELG